MKIAYLVLAHDQPSQLGRLVQELESEDSFFFIHVDRKSEHAAFKRAVGHRARVTFLKGRNRVRVYWCGYSTVTAILNLLREATRSGEDFDRYCLLSAADFPIKGRAHREEILASDTEFMRVDRKLEFTETDEFSLRVRAFHFFDEPSWNPRTARSRRIFELSKRVLHRLPWRRYNKIPMYHGAAWWALTPGCVRHVLRFVDDNPAYAKFHRYTYAPDEIFFHSIIKASPFAKNIRHDFEAVTHAGEVHHSEEHGSHFIDWRTQSPDKPKVLDMSDFDRLLASKCLFARKFRDPRSNELALRLQEHLRTPCELPVERAAFAPVRDADHRSPGAD